jgi:hypothetical protein
MIRVSSNPTARRALDPRARPASARPVSARRRAVSAHVSRAGGRESTGADAPLRSAGVSEVHIVRLVALEGRLLRAFNDGASQPWAARADALRSATDGYFAGCSDVAVEYERCGRNLAARAVMEGALAFLEALLPEAHDGAGGAGTRSPGGAGAEQQLHADALLEGVRVVCQRVSKTLRASTERVASAVLANSAAARRGARGAAQQLGARREAHREWMHSTGMQRRPRAAPPAAVVVADGLTLAELLLRIAEAQVRRAPLRREMSRRAEDSGR